MSVMTTAPNRGRTAGNSYPTKAEITRALDAARKSDLVIERFEVAPRGVIRVFVKEEKTPQGNAYDDWTRRKKQP